MFADIHKIQTQQIYIYRYTRHRRAAFGRPLLPAVTFFLLHAACCARVFFRSCATSHALRDCAWHRCAAPTPTTSTGACRRYRIYIHRYLLYEFIYRLDTDTRPSAAHRRLQRRSHAACEFFSFGFTRSARIFFFRGCAASHALRDAGRRCAAQRGACSARSRHLHTRVSPLPLLRI